MKKLENGITAVIVILLLVFVASVAVNLLGDLSFSGSDEGPNEEQNGENVDNGATDEEDEPGVYLPDVIVF